MFSQFRVSLEYILGTYRQLCFVYSIVPWPTLLVTADSLTINLAGLVSVMCTVELPEEVDIPVAVDIQWNIPSPIHGNSRIYIRRDDSGLPLVFKSIVSINPIVFSDAGLYTCITSIDYRGSDDPQVTGVPWVTQGVTIDVCESIVIIITNICQLVKIHVWQISESR